MTVTWELKGNTYHENKDKFKTIRNESGLRFLGFEAMAWENAKENVKLIRETELGPDGREHTKSVALVWKGRKETALLRGMRELFNQLAENVRVEGVVKTPEQIREETLVKFDSDTEYIVNKYEEEGLGPGWINCYREERAGKKEHLFEEDKPKDNEITETEITVRKFMETNNDKAYNLEELCQKYPKFEEKGIREVLEEAGEIEHRDVDADIGEEKAYRYYHWKGDK